MSPSVMVSRYEVHIPELVPQVTMAERCFICENEMLAARPHWRRQAPLSAIGSSPNRIHCFCSADWPVARRDRDGACQASASSRTDRARLVAPVKNVDVAD